MVWGWHTRGWVPPSGCHFHLFYVYEQRLSSALNTSSPQPSNTWYRNCCNPLHRLCHTVSPDWSYHTMNETTLVYPVPARSIPTLGWSCDTDTLFTNTDETPLAEQAQADFSIEALLEQHAREQEDLASSSSSTDGISSRALFGNRSAQNSHKEMNISPMVENVRPGTSLRLSSWGMQAAQKVGLPCPIPQGEELRYPRSNALVRRYTQWHTIQPQ